MVYISEALRRQVIDRAAGVCEYCRLHQRDSLFLHELDHIIPVKHRGQTVAENLCLSCLDCNRFKGSNFASFDPETERIIPLFNPRVDTWSDHFALLGPEIVGMTPEGRVTVYILNLNNPQRLALRRQLIAAGRYPA